MILSTRSHRPHPYIRLTRATSGPARRRPAPLPGPLHDHDPDWALREIVEAVTSDPGR